jgi:hypothetical protein
MKKKIKSWLIRTLHKWLNKLEPEKTFRVEHINVPISTLNASFIWPKNKQISEDRINEILARDLAEEVIKYADIEMCEKIDMSVLEEYVVFRATVKVAGERRKGYEAKKDYTHDAASCGQYTL